MSASRETIIEVVRCPACQSRLVWEANDASTANESLHCANCGERFPVIDGIPRMLLEPLRKALIQREPANGSSDQQIKTAESFGYEWNRFHQMYQEWEQVFWDYMQPRGPEFFSGK